MKQIEQLALVFVDAFDLYVEQAIGVDADGQPGHRQLGQTLFIGVFHGAKFNLEGFIIRQLGQLAQLRQIGDPALANAPADQLGQIGVRLVQPQARRDAIGDVGQLAGVITVEIGKDRGFHQL